MGDAESSTLLPLTAWEVETLRLTAFPVPASPARDHSWWSELIGEPPEIVSNRPREGAKTEEGAFSTGRLINVVLPVRIDWLLVPSKEPGSTAEYSPSVGRLSELLEPFAQLMGRWLGLETCPTLVRLALGAVVSHPAESRVAGYRQLAAYLPYVRLDPDNSSDFFYQINRPRIAQSGVTGLTLNRLSAWSVSFRQEMGIGIMLGSSQLPHAVVGRQAYACRLQLDINTDQNRSEPLPRDSLGQLLEQLTGLAKEIVGGGDMP